MLNHTYNHVNGGKTMTRYPGAKYSDCDHYEKGNCKEPNAKKKNGGKCNGNKTDCFYWELTQW